MHVGGTLDEIAAAEAAPWQGRHSERPFVLVAQPSLFDATRAPPGRHTLWAYCHVPHGSTVDMTAAIDAQIERFAPGFGDVVLARHVTTPAAFAAGNANLVGGDITGGVTDWRQLVGRPTWSLHPWRTPAAGLYLCSASTPPGGGAHGLCGWHAARLASAARTRATDRDSGARNRARAADFACGNRVLSGRGLEGEGHAAGVEDRLVDGAGGDAVTGGRRRGAQRLGRQAEAAVDHRRRNDRAGALAEAVGHLHLESPPSTSRTARTRHRRSIRTPRWARRTLAGARSPLRDSSLPAMWSGVTRIARGPSSSARATAIGPPIGSISTTSPASGNDASPSRSVPTSV